MITDSEDQHGSDPVPTLANSLSWSSTGRTGALAQRPRTQDPWDPIPNRGASESNLTNLGSYFQHDRPASRAWKISGPLRIDDSHFSRYEGREPNPGGAGAP